MNILKKYIEYIRSYCSPSSNLPGSYVRALRYTSEALRAYVPKYSVLPPIWEIRSLDIIDELYQFVKEEERKGENGAFGNSKFPMSYLKQRFCTNALKTFGRFISLALREKAAFETYENEFDANLVAEKISSLPIKKPQWYLDDDERISSQRGRETIRQVKQRQNQWIFRQMMLKNYGSACCLTGLPVLEALRASHIVGWSENEKTRLLPTNGLCLAATYDAVFDKHLITFDDDLRMVLSPLLREYCTNTAFENTFRHYEGTQLQCHVRFPPDKVLMARHREQLRK